MQTTENKTTRAYAIRVRSKQEMHHILTGRLETTDAATGKFVTSYKTIGHPIYEVHGGETGDCAILVDDDEATLQVLHIGFIRTIRPGIKEIEYRNVTRRE